MGLAQSYISKTVVHVFEKYVFWELRDKCSIFHEIFITFQLNPFKLKFYTNFPFFKFPNSTTEKNKNFVKNT